MKVFKVSGLVPRRRLIRDYRNPGFFVVGGCFHPSLPTDGKHTPSIFIL